MRPCYAAVVLFYSLCCLLLHFIDSTRTSIAMSDDHRHFPRQPLRQLGQNSRAVACTGSVGVGRSRKGLSDMTANLVFQAIDSSTSTNTSTTSVAMGDVQDMSRDNRMGSWTQTRGSSHKQIFTGRFGVVIPG